MERTKTGLRPNLGKVWVTKSARPPELEGK